MNLEFIVLGGYGQFVWSAFIFTIVSCLFLYLKTKNELQKQEKMFLNEGNELQAVKIENTKQKETAKEILSGSSTF